MEITLHTALRPMGHGPQTVGTFQGTRSSDGAEVLIGVDHRPAGDIREAIAAGEIVTVEVEDWQILRVMA